MIAMYEGIDEGVKIGWYLSIVGIVVALILIIISLTMFTKKSNGWGITLMVLSAGVGGASIYSFRKFGKGTPALLANEFNKNLQTITAAVKGSAEDEFDGDVVLNMSNGCGCVEGGDYVDDLNYIESDVATYKGGSDVNSLKKILEV